MARPSAFEQALAAPAVRQALAAAAEARLNRARYLAYKAGRIHFGDNMRVITGVRPGTKSTSGIKRPYARITSSTTPEEQAADTRQATLSRTQILRRSM